MCSWQQQKASLKMTKTAEFWTRPTEQGCWVHWRTVKSVGKKFFRNGYAHSETSAAAYIRERIAVIQELINIDDIEVPFVYINGQQLKMQKSGQIKLAHISRPAKESDVPVNYREYVLVVWEEDDVGYADKERTETAFNRLANRPGKLVKTIDLGDEIIHFYNGGWIKAVNCEGGWVGVMLPRKLREVVTEINIPPPIDTPESIPIRKRREDK